MRIVKWSPQERVDIPDKTAENFLVLGEFRRTIREVFLGEGENYILRGFKVEPESPASALIVVKLDNGGGVYSAALGSENVGSTAYGQLMGGRDDDQNLEGNAQQTLSFAGQPNATYRVQMRFVYADGVNDNRAFWNPTTDTEFIANVATRHLPGFELRRSGGASDEWIDLADVVWGGATIVAGNITDVRTFALEGAAPYYRTTQSGSGGMEDFARSDPRGELAYGLNSVYPVLRALARQIQDLKGPDIDGRWNWFARVFRPHDPETELGLEDSKSLRSVDTVTYTIGDGVTTFGDFNGATGLESCLQLIENAATGNTVAQRIQILLKSEHDPGTPSFTFNITTAHVFAAALKHLHIVGNRNTAIALSHPAASSAIEMQATDGHLTLDKIVMASATTNNGTCFRATHVHIHECKLVGNSSASATPVVRCAGSASDSSEIRDSRITGLIQVDGSGVDATGGNPEDQQQAWPPLLINNTTITGAVKTAARGANDISIPLKMVNCRLFLSSTHVWGAAAAIDLENNADCSIIDSEVTYIPDVPAVRLDVNNSDYSQNIHIRGCRFYHDDITAPATGGAQAIEVNQVHDLFITDCLFEMSSAQTGTNDGGAIDLSGGELMNIIIRGCTFNGNSVASRGATNPAIYLNGVTSRLDISGNMFSYWAPGAGSGSERCIVAGGSLQLTNATINGNVFEGNGGHSIRLNAAAFLDNIAICSNTIRGIAAADLGISYDTAINTSVVGNNIQLNVAGGVAITGGTTGDSIVSGNRVHNGTIATTGAIMYGFSGGGGPTDLNYVT